MNAGTPIRVLVVDDSAFMRRAVISMLSGDPGIQIVGEAKTGADGLRQCASLKPDVVTLDIEMPEMDGLTALSKIMAECPTHVIMLSSLTVEGSHAALTALQLGAAEVMAKDASSVSLKIVELKDELIAKVKALGQARRPGSRRAPQGKISIAPTAIPDIDAAKLDIVCIGSSTGGPPVVEQLVRSLPSAWRLPIIIAQHMPEIFTKSMADRLASAAAVPVKHLSEGAGIEPGTVHICPGGNNTHIRRDRLGKLTVAVNRDPAGTVYFPSVDALFTSAAETTGARTLAIVLTGMGDDGSKGAKKLKEKGGMILAQNEETCVVYGMPRAVTVASLVAASLSPADLAKVLSTLGGSGVMRRAG